MKIRILIFLLFLFCAIPAFAFEKTITIAAEEPEGVTLDLKPGKYLVEYAGGAITLCYPINPNYSWLVACAIGCDVGGYQDEPNLGKIYYQPNSPTKSQARAEEEAIEALRDKLPGVSCEFSLAAPGEVRFWVSDFDYSDNNGMLKLKVRSLAR